MKHDTRHGGPFDRGGADYYYNRGFDPHYFTGATYASDRIEKADMTPEELDGYRAGYAEAESFGDKKGYE